MEWTPGMILVLGMAVLVGIAIWGVIHRVSDSGWSIRTLNTEYPTVFDSKTLMNAVITPRNVGSVEALLKSAHVTLNDVLLLIGSTVSAETLKSGKAIVTVTVTKGGKELADKIQSMFAVTATQFTPTLENTFIAASIANVYPNMLTIFAGCTSTSVQFSRHLVPQLGGTVDYSDFNDETLGLIVNAIVTNPDCQLICPGILSFMVPHSIRSNQVWITTADVAATRMQRMTKETDRKESISIMLRILNNLGNRSIIVGSII